MATIRKKPLPVVVDKIEKQNPHSDICAIACRILKTTFGCAVAVKEFVTLNSESPDAFGYRNSGHETYLIEVKVSRSDFLADKNKSFRKNPNKGIGLYRYYMAPKGMISTDELPDKWGLIEVCDNGKCVVIKGKKPKTWGGTEWEFRDRNVLGEITIMYSLCRRMFAGDNIEKWT